MKTTNYRKIALTFGGILIATVAAGCYGGGGSGYSNNPYGYNSGYSSYGSAYPYRGYNNGYSYQRSYGNSYNTGYQNGVRADANRDRREDHISDQHAGVANRDSAVARTETSHSRADHTEKN
ncbi:MAG: hypothetical protein WAU82_12075 [Candidatus Binatus sp.]|uniref:hypothetical protein n=1 Tax=Candidatus Binatus sp. TaxID=2811406 RepID=UPI003BB12CC7